MNQTTEKQYYAAWWRRILAHLIDLCVVVPIVVLQTRLGTYAPRMVVPFIIPVAVVVVGYFVYCHARWGRTFGKLVTGIRVVALDGKQISWRQAVLRNAGEIVFYVPYCAVFMYAYNSVALPEYLSVPAQQRFKIITAQWPSWSHMVSNLNAYWGWSEFVVMLFNKRRRAIHDFMGGTVVVQRQPMTRQAKDDDPYRIDPKELKRLGKL